MNKQSNLSGDEKKSRRNKRFSTFVILYLMVGLIVAIVFMLNYHWRPTGLFSPGFFAVILTWPLQVIGLIRDLQVYGWGGKPF